MSTPRCNSTKAAGVVHARNGARSFSASGAKSVPLLLEDESGSYHASCAPPAASKEEANCC